MQLKYELTDETKIIGNHRLHRIRALMDFGMVKKGSFLKNIVQRDLIGMIFITKPKNFLEVLDLPLKMNSMLRT